MYNQVRRKLGAFKRGLQGMKDTVFDRAPQISDEVVMATIGHSVQGLPIECCKFGNGERKVLFYAAIHGNEVGTIKLAHHLINWLHETGGIEGLTVYVIPCLNKDGYKVARRHPNYFNYGRIGRFNGNNVDLNRNFPTVSHEQYNDWTHGKNYAERTEVFCGEYGGSEPEIKALTQFVMNNDIDVLIALHNAGSDVMGCGTDFANELAARFSELTGFSHIPQRHWHTLQQTGTAAEWCEEHDITHLEIEGTGRWSSDWNVQKEGLQEVLQMVAGQKQYV